MHKEIEQKIKELPQKPGVYIYKDEAGTILYVGKAVKLKNRVSSYFKKGAGKDSIRIQTMISKIRDFDYIVTSNELESLVLENNLIKEHHPRYNVRMRDDKNYLFLKICMDDEIPTISYERKVTERKSKYFGPYTDGRSAKETLRTVRHIFPYCANTKVGTKPCFFYHIQQCPGVCFGKVSPEEYKQQTVSKIISFLEGKQGAVLDELQSSMKFLARHKQYEKAAKVRDQIFALNRVLERQKIVYSKKINQDVFSLHLEPSCAAVNLFRIREGKLIQKENFIIENTKNASEAEILEQFLPKYYLDASALAQEVLLPVKIEESELNDLFRTLRDPNSKRGVTKIVYPSHGPKAELVKMGQMNAKQYIEAQSDKALLEEARLMASLKELQRVLKMKEIPGRMECFDISNIQGTNAVGSMVVFDYARPKKNEYRKFKIKTKSTPDDFAMMKEMLTRRFARSTSEEVKKWPLPQLIIIDGGKGQLSTAVAVMRSHNLDIPIIGLAKRIEEIFLPGSSVPILLPPNSIALYLLQRIRDEAHRFAITYHRKLRSKSSLSSALDDIQGIGDAKKKKLLDKFGSVARIKQASITDISEIVGKKLAEKIKASLQ